MCSKTPKIPQPKDKPVQYLANPYLDGLAIGSERGRNGLRIDQGSNASASPPRAIMNGLSGLAIPTVAPTPAIGNPGGRSVGGRYLTI